MGYFGNTQKIRLLKGAFDNHTRKCPALCRPGGVARAVTFRDIPHLWRLCPTSAT
jgi:hypothetical protein